MTAGAPGEDALLADSPDAGGREAAVELFAGPGEVRALGRTLDWGATPLGWPDTWSPALRIPTRAMLDAPFPICLWSGSEYALVYNDAYRRILSAKHPAALGQPGAVVWAEIWEGLEAQFAQVRAGGPPVYFEEARFEMARREDGGTEDAWFNYSLSALRDEDGGVAAVLNIALETTARVRAEGALAVERARLEEVFRRSPSFAVAYRGPEHRYEFVNEAYYQLVGRRDVLGRPLDEAIPEAREQGFTALLDRVLGTGEPWVGRETPVELERTPGAPRELRYVDMVFQPLVEADGTRSGVLAHGVDITEQVLARREVERLLAESERARDEAERTRAEAEGAGRLKSEFLATMSHEFRTPLNAILGYAQLLDMGVLGATTPAQNAHLERLQASARHLLQLVDDVLDVAKVDADRMEVRRDRLATGAAVAAALALVQPQATAKGIRVEDLGVPGPGVPYVGDEHRVRQILVNLLANAVKFTPPGGTITVACGTASALDPGVQPGGSGSGARAGRDAAADGGREPGRRWAFVRVEDTGPGIAPELRGRLFEPFTQGDGALTRAHGGTGLGLAISRRLARLMGGDLVLETRPGAGGAFRLWLPAPDEAGLPSATEPQTATGEAESTKRRTPPGVAAVPVRRPADGASLDAEAYAVVLALGARLAADAETISERYVAALRADPRFPGVRDLPGVQLRDHTTPVVSLLATQLMTIGETRGRAPELLADGAEVQRVMAELHGAQRHRLGWGEADIEREGPLLVAEVERALDGALRPAGDATAVAGDAGAGATGIDHEAVAVAGRYAADVSRHVLDQSTQTALRAFRFARAAAGP